MMNARFFFTLICFFQYSFLLSMDISNFDESKRSFPTLEQVEICVMEKSNDLDLKCLRLYFILLTKEKNVTEQDVAEILGVSQSTVNRFKNLGTQSDYVCQQFLRYKKNKGTSIYQLKEEVDRKYSHITSAEQIEEILMMAKTEYLLPSAIKKRESLILYFEKLLGNDMNKLNQCDSILNLKGKLIDFVKKRDVDSNLTKLIYTHLLDYYRGVRCVFEKNGRRFVSLSEQLGWQTEQSAAQPINFFSDYFNSFFGFSKKKDT
ncbi:MAG: hypothetical protein CNLJKLNK_00426 [Holosporales bacterium]